MKGHFVESHIPKLSRHFGALGVHGEDGIEALHPEDNKSGIMTRSIRNPIKRHKAKFDNLRLKASTKTKKGQAKRSHEEYAASQAAQKVRGNEKRARSAAQKAAAAAAATGVAAAGAVAAGAAATALGTIRKEAPGGEQGAARGAACPRAPAYAPGGNAPWGSESG